MWILLILLVFFYNYLFFKDFLLITKTFYMYLRCLNNYVPCIFDIVMSIIIPNGRLVAFLITASVQIILQ